MMTTGDHSAQRPRSAALRFRLLANSRAQLAVIDTSYVTLMLVDIATIATT